MIKFIVTIVYVGFLPYAPGTFGSIAAILAGYWLQVWGGLPALICFTLAFFFLGWVLTYLYLLENNSSHDPQEIVIDEVVGQWVTYLPLSAYTWIFELSIFSYPLFDWLIALILFRIFDIWKPWPVGWADRQNNALGVMLDDVLAAIYAASSICILLIILSLGKVS
jgi:phosphatidylglycerophosphatase A